MKDKGSHPFICGVRGAHFRCGFKANGVAGAGGFLHTFTDDLRILLVPVSHLVSSGFSIASAHAFMNSKAGLQMVKTVGHAIHLCAGQWLHVPWGHIWMQCSLHKWEEALEKTKKNKVIHD